jgi:hypothetical protein
MISRHLHQSIDAAIIGDGRAFVSFLGTHAAYVDTYVPRQGWDEGRIAVLNDTYQQAIAFSPQGKGLLVSTQPESNRVSLYASEYTASGTWSAGQPIESHANTAVHPSVVMDSGGNAYAVWLERAASFDYRVWGSRFVAGEGWETAYQIYSSDLVDQPKPRVAMDQNGNALVLWLQFDPATTATKIWYCRYMVGSGWTAPAVLGTTTGDSEYEPIMASGSDGTFWIGWVSGNRVYVRRFTSAGGAGPAQPLQSVQDSASELQLAVDGTGNLMAVWMQTASDGLRSVWVNRSTSPSTWEGAQQLGVDAWAPAVAMDGRGHAHVLFFQYSDGSVNAMARRYRPGVGWDPGASLYRALSSHPPPSNGKLVVKVTAAGNAVAVWPVYLGIVSTMFD